MDEDELRLVLAAGIAELVPGARCVGCSILAPGRCFDVHVWLDEGAFCVSTRYPGRREFVVFDLADPGSVGGAVGAIVGWV
jgi:hypothetical protein